VKAMGRVLSGKYPVIKSSEFVIPRQIVPPGASITLLEPTYYSYALLLFHGDGGSTVELNIRMGSKSATIHGYTQAIGVVTDDMLEITARNIGAGSQETQTIEIAYLLW